MTNFRATEEMGEKTRAICQVRTACSMPDDERSGLYDPEEEFPWDFDNSYPLDPGDDDDEDDE